MDNAYCPKCHKKLVYYYYHYGHIGSYYCQNCDFKRGNPDFTASHVDLDNKTMLVNNNEVLKKIPTKMAKELSRNDKYRIYYNKLEPIIYMDIKDKYISLYLRYLVHPKKNRNIESEIWNEIYKLNLNNEILLYSEK